MEYRESVGLLLAIAEAAMGGQKGQCPRRATIILFGPDADRLAQVDPVVVPRALMLTRSGY
jgi:hypothetical protein